MRKRVSGLFLTLAILTSFLSGMYVSKFVVADSKFYSSEFAGNLMVATPQSNITYSGTLPLKFTIEYGSTVVIWEFNGVVSYSIDGGSSAKISTNHLEQFGDGMNLSVNINKDVNISNLTNGVHTLILFNGGSYTRLIDMASASFNVSFSTISFSVYNVAPTNILVNSPQNISYDLISIQSSSIPLNFTVDKPTSWIGYCLDNQTNTTVTGNTTLTGLSVGKHSLVVFANDTIGNMGASQTVNFTIEKPQTESLVNPAMIATVVVSVLVLVLIVSLLFFRRHRKTLPS
jgi:hypothetical protein